MGANSLAVFAGFLLSELAFETNLISSSFLTKLNLIFIVLGIILLPFLYDKIIKEFETDKNKILKDINNKQNHENIFKKYALTKREKEVAKLLINEKTYKKISEEIGISQNTVKTHVKNIYYKFEVKNKKDLIKKVTNSF